MQKIVLILNDYVTNVCQILAIIVIMIGIIKALWTFLTKAVFKKDNLDAIRESRMEVGHAFSLGLAFLIGSSILKSVIAPSWDDIGKLTAIIIIRTALNYFLMKEVETTRSILKIKNNSRN